MKYKSQGVWDKEDDLYMFTSHGLVCYIIRNPAYGHLCGYVVVPEDHPMHGLKSWAADSRLDFVPHGGITFRSNQLYGLDLGSGWALGFDCNHAGDCAPAYKILGTYRDVPYVRADLTRFAEAVSKYKRNYGPHSGVSSGLYHQALFSKTDFWDEGDLIDSLYILREELKFLHSNNLVKENCNV